MEAIRGGHQGSNSAHPSSPNSMWTTVIGTLYGCGAVEGPPLRDGRHLLGQRSGVCHDGSAAFHHLETIRLLRAPEPATGGS
jgi:hypothetical protein